MTTGNQSGIAVIGDTNLTTLLRLAGVSHYYIIEDNESVDSSVRDTMINLVEDPAISIIAIQSDFSGYVRDIINRVSEDKRLFPVIIEVPSAGGIAGENAAAYYRAFVRKFVGFDIEI